MSRKIRMSRKSQDDPLRGLRSTKTMRMASGRTLQNDYNNIYAYSKLGCNAQATGPHAWQPFGPKIRSKFRKCDTPNSDPREAMGRSRTRHRPRHFGHCIKMLMVPCSVLCGTRTRKLFATAQRPFSIWLMTPTKMRPHKPMLAEWSSEMLSLSLSLTLCLDSLLDGRGHRDGYVSASMCRVLLRLLSKQKACCSKRG